MIRHGLRRERRRRRHPYERRAGARAALVAAVAVLGTSGAALAQSDVTLGVRGGVSVASASLDLDTFSDENRTGLVGGAFLAFQPGLLGLQFEALYHEKGFREENGPSDLDLAYLEIPALLKLGLPLAVIRPGVFGGVAVAFETRCEFQGLDCEDAGLETKGTDLSGVFGADLMIGLGGLSLWADGRYTVGFSDIHEAGDVFEDIKNRSWDFTAGVGISP